MPTQPAVSQPVVDYTVSNASVTLTAPTWTTWINNTYNTTVITTAWTIWVNGTANQYQQIQPVYVAPSAEEIERQRLAAELQQKEQAEADQRAAKLLEEHLDPVQKESWHKAKVIELDSQRGKRYRIKRGIAGNVFELDKDGKEVTKLCCHPDGIPVDDVVLAQVLALKYCEEHFVNTANKTRLAA